MTRRRISARAISDLLVEALALFGIELSCADICMLYDISPAQFSNGKRYAQQHGVPIMYDARARKYRLPTTLEGGEEYVVRRLRIIETHLASTCGFIAGLGERFPKRASEVQLVHTQTQLLASSVGGLAGVLGQDLERAAAS